MNILRLAALAIIDQQQIDSRCEYEIDLPSGNTSSSRERRNFGAYLPIFKKLFFNYERAHSVL